MSAAPAVLLRDEYGEPIMTLVERDRDGRLCRPWFAYLWVPAGVAAARARGLDAMDPAQRAAYAAAIPR